MTSHLPSYPKYQEADPDWLCNVPDHWGLRPLIGVLREKLVPNTGLQETRILSLSYGRIIVKSAEKLGGLVPESFETYQIVYPGDIIIRSTDLQNDRTSLRVGFVRDKGIITSAYMCLQPIGGLIPEYAYHLLHVFDISKAIYRYGTGLRQNLAFSDVKRLQIPVPPHDEQEAIVRFLDHADQRIRRYIRAKRRQIKLLEEQKQAIIQQAVTRGLDPSVRMKDSGIQGAEDIPSHWRVTRIKNEFYNLDSHRIPLSSVERGEMTTRQYDYYGASGVIDKVDDYIFDDELILIAEDGANLVLRNLPLVFIARGKFWVNNHAHVLKPKSGNIEYLAHLLETFDYRRWITGAAQPKLTRDRLMAVPMFIPPVEEQNCITGFIEAQTRSINEQLELITREITLIREYQTSFAASVVSGKLDVREAAHNLSEMVDDEPNTDQDALGEALSEEIYVEDWNENEEE